MSIWAECARLAHGGGLGALASVVRRRGSLPMSATAKLLVFAGGARTGTIGGGCLEAEITEHALDVMQTRRPTVTRHSLNAEMAGDYGLTCGGTATILIEPVFNDDVLCDVYAAAAESAALGDPAVAVTDTAWTYGPVKALVRAGEVVGFTPPDRVRAALSLLEEIEAPQFHRGYVLDPVTPSPPLLVFGGGHVGAAVTRAAAAAGWRVTVVDDRPEFSDPLRHAAASATVCCDFHDISSVVPLTSRTYAVIATRGHQHDALILDQLARRELRYIGMLGSRRKVALTWRLLESWGVSREQLERVRAPIGVPIGADTPEEIAISVVAEMISVRRRGSRRRGGVVVSSAEAGTSLDDT